MPRSNEAFPPNDPRQALRPSTGINFPQDPSTAQQFSSPAVRTSQAELRGFQLHAEQMTTDGELSSQAKPGDTMKTEAPFGFAGRPHR